MAADRDSLQIHEHLGFQRRFAVFRHVCVGLLVLLVLAALAGALGSGPLSSAKAGSGALRVEYDRFVHRRNPVHLRVQVAPSGEPLDLTVEGGLVTRFDLDHVAPQPQQAVLTGEVAHYRFAAGTTQVVLELDPRRAGPVAGRIAIGSDGTDLDMFVYP